MEKTKIGFLILAFGALLLAGILTWNLVTSKTSPQGANVNSLESPSHDGPQRTAVGKGIVYLGKKGGREE